MNLLSDNTAKHELVFLIFKTRATYVMYDTL